MLSNSLKEVEVVMKSEALLIGNKNMSEEKKEEIGTKEDVLVIDQNLKGLDFKLARCCNPIYGDDVFGFVSVTGGICLLYTSPILWETLKRNGSSTVPETSA